MTDIAPPRDLSLREVQRGMTRRLLIDAFARVVLRDGLHDFSMQAVADEARCSARTLYRYFPSREALLAGLDDQFQEFAAACFDRIPGNVEGDLAELMAAVGLAVDARRDLVKAWSAAELSAEFHDAAHRRAVAWVDAAIDRGAPHLGADERIRLRGGLRQIVSLRAWLSLTDQLSAEDAAATVRWMIRTLLADVAGGGGPTIP